MRNYAKGLFIMKAILLVIISTFLISSCTGARSKIETETYGGLRLISSNPDNEVTIVKTHGSLERFCASRDVDAVATTSGSLGLTVAGDSISEGASNGDMSLGGMSPTVLIVSELLYRVCELSVNLNLDEEATLEIYKVFLDAAVKINGDRLGEGSAGMSSNPSLPETNNSSPSGSGPDGDPQ